MQRAQALFRKHRIKITAVVLLLIAYIFCLPKPLFDKPYSTVIESRESLLLGAQIASDGQWRFPEQDSVPAKFKHAILLFEDEYFYRHWGLNPVAISKALVQNIKARKVVRGGSTLTQQTLRLAREGKRRTVFEKAIEAVQATRLEFKYSKDKILALYASHAPFGGNVVGLDMASWRYFGVPPQQLSWAESATLAVLPNAPKLIYPGKNQESLLRKRNALLEKLHRKQIIDLQTLELALEEPLPSKPHALPQMAPHLLLQVAQKSPQKRIRTTVQYETQKRASQLVQNYYEQYRQSEIYNMAVLVVDVKTREVITYIGNSPTTSIHKKDVDIVQAPRSTGSILKPFLHAAMLDDAELLPEQLVPDIPTQISGYSPQNYNLSYEGAVAANRALSRSLNIPSVLLLQEYGIQRFYEQLQKLGLKHINKHPNHYGLSLILGGAESSLWDLCKAYAGMASTLNYYQSNSGKYRENEWSALHWDLSKPVDFGSDLQQKNKLGAAAIWQTFEAMKEVNRPEGDEAWRFYDSALQIAWKTGTSFGNRDGWAIGVNARYVVGVWVGNATGEGRPSLTGVSTAAPVLFDVFNLLPKAAWFSPPYNDLEEINTCAISGFLAASHCPISKTQIPARAKKTKLCPYHQLVHLDSTQSYRVNSSCESTDRIHSQSWFVLPPIMAFYYKNYHVSYKTLPPYRADCIATASGSLDFIYPKHQAKLYLAKDFNSKIQAFVAKAATASSQKTLYWYLDHTYLGSTTNFHELEIKTRAGVHLLNITDSNGNEKTIEFEIK